jgi:hypothetical protein
MATITNTIEVEKTLGRWKPSDLAYIERLSYECAADGHPSTLEITGLAQRRDLAIGGWPSDIGELFRIRLAFRHIRDLKITAFNARPKQVTGFDITDVSDRGWEDVCFEVEDYENGYIHFLCKEIEVIQVTRA